MKTLNVILVIGTRPEAIKMAPVYLALRKNPNLRTRILLTGQHPTMAKEVLGLFGISAEIEVDVFNQGQSLAKLNVRLADKILSILEDEKPDVILVQGDTSSAMIAGLLGFLLDCKVGHIEAGLRTTNIKSPFPEEFNRRVVSLSAHWHFAPTAQAKENLTLENIRDNVFVVGNTVVDAAIAMSNIDTPGIESLKRDLPFLSAESSRVVLITAHRRENLGQPMIDIARSIEVLANRFPSVNFVLPVHPNPAVRSIFHPILAPLENVFLQPPLAYDQTIWLIKKAILILTDSGGIQEEAPVFGTPVLVLRNETERSEGIDAGCAKLVGTDPQAIVNAATVLLSDEVLREKMAIISNPYGDGLTSDRIQKILHDYINQ